MPFGMASITSGLRLISRIIGDTDERSTFEETVRNLCEPTLRASVLCKR